MQTRSAGDFLFEGGPNTVLDRYESTDELIDLVGLGDECVRVRLRDSERFIWHGGELHQVPQGPGGLFGTQLFSFAAKLRIFREPWVAPVQEDESLRDFVVRRLGSEVYERAFLPMVCGVSAGDPARMSAELSFPVMKEMERASGSLIGGFINRMRSAAKERRASGKPRRDTHMISFGEGLVRLPQALADFLGEDFRPGTPISHVEPRGDDAGFRIHGSDQTWQADRVILCGDATSTSQWIEPFASELSEKLRATHYCPLAVVGLGVKSNSLRLPPGFGFLATRGQGVRVLGSIFNSNFFAGRAPEGCAALTVMVGGDLDPEGANLSDEALTELVKKDLGTILDWNGEAEEIVIQRWPGAIPQYGLAHQQTLDEIERTERQFPGLTFFGNWRGGAAIGERIELARQTANALAGRIATSD